MNKFDKQNQDKPADRTKTVFTLPPESWEAFCDALDAPPKDIPALRELFSKPVIFKEPS